jgi:hypothetical protein
MTITPRRDYYVYVLFDEHGIPRYVGKGCGRRITSTLKPRGRNHMKNAFVKRTIEVLGEVPLVMIRENLSEEQAFGIEIALIGAIGRRKTKTGPLTNISVGGDGITSNEARQLAANYTPMERWLVNKAISEAHLKYSPEERKAKAIKASLSIPPEQRRINGFNAAMGFTPEERRSRAQKASASADQERRREIGREWAANLTPEQRSKAGQLGSSKLTKDQRKANGVKAAATMRARGIVRDWCAESRWINNGKMTRRLKPNEQMPEGWAYGRRLSKADSNEAQ